MGQAWDFEAMLAEEEQYALAEEIKYIVVIIYDIADNRQRLKVAKYLSGFGKRVQKSAFEARLGKKAYERLLQGLKRLIWEEDNVRVYKLYGEEEVSVFGNAVYEQDEDVIII